ncbi:MAG: hypothetical protein LC772_05775, partial [Chloroflexi bacterium]|nr:hypothetical protein [Chloroflexota bacterium]
RYTLPPFMTPGGLAPVNDRGHKNDSALYIPVEDVDDGWTPCGKIGQEIYGSGGPMMFAAYAFVRVPDAGLAVYAEYPVRSAQWTAAGHSLTIRISGVATHDSLVAISIPAGLAGWKEPGKLKITTVPAAPVTDRQDSDGMTRFRTAGSTTITIQPASQ